MTLPSFQNWYFLNRYLPNHRVSPIGDLYSMDISLSPMDGFNRVIKRIEDIILSSLILLLISPACLVIALALKLTSPGPVLFKQYRYGRSNSRL